MTPDKATALPDVFTRYQPFIRSNLEGVFGNQPAPLIEMLQYHLGWIDEEGAPIENNTGKGVRPSLCLFACETLGGNYRDALSAAVAVELIHNFSLIHDDIQDGDVERRHRPTVWYRWGHSHGLNAGVAMNILGNMSLIDYAKDKLNASLTLEISRILTRACAAMIEGQVLDVNFEQRKTIRVNDYLEMIEKKTGALLAASLQMGALIGTQETAAVDSMLSFGKWLGQLFQIRDDMLGVWGNQDKTGKPAGSDLRRRKKSLPVVHALSVAEGESRGKFLEIYGADRPLDDNDITILHRIMDEVETSAYCQDLAESSALAALKTLDTIPLSTASKEEYTVLTEFLLVRDY